MRFITALFLLGIAGANSSCRTVDSASSTKIIPAMSASSHQFPSVVKLLGCTGFKIASRSYLTSARCIFDFANKIPVSEAQIGVAIRIGYGINSEKSVKIVKIIGIKVHAEFDAFLKKTDLDPLSASDFKTVTDIAIIESDTAIPEVSPAILSKDFWSSNLQTAIVAGYGLASDPFSQESSTRLSQTQGQDLFWNRFTISSADAKRFYARSGSIGEEGTDTVKLMGADRGAPVFLDGDKPAFEKIIGMSSGDGLDKKSYFVAFSDKIVACVANATKDSRPKAVKSPAPYEIFCE